MSPQDALAIFAAGLAAGTVNVIVGSGSLITFPTLLALGYPPVLANVSNTVGLVPGSVSVVVAYRRELVGQRRRLLQLGSRLLGGVSGAVLLLSLPHGVFKAAVPALIAIAALLMAAQPRISAGLERRGSRRVHGGAALLTGVLPHRRLRRLLRSRCRASSSSPSWPSSSTTTCSDSMEPRTSWPSS